jgi:hypothetical protein
LRDSCSDGGGEVVFGVATASDHEGAKGAGAGVSVADGVGVELGTENGDGNGIVEDKRRIEKLVGGPATGDSASGHADSAGVHRG